MKQIGQYFFRSLVMFATVLLVVALALPLQQTAAATANSDDFNTCTYDTTFWKLENPASIPGAAPVISGMYGAAGKPNATMSMTVPAGTAYTFSDEVKKEAPRIWHTIPNGDFSYKVRFLAPFTNPTDSYKIMGVLVRDNSNTSAPKYFRFDYNSRVGGLNEYIGFIQGTSRVDIVPVTDLPGGNPAAGGLYLTVSYVKATSTWTITYQIGESGTYTKTETFQSPAAASGFVVTDIGLFVGSTMRHDIQNPPPPPGATMVVDYFQDLSETTFANDTVKLTVTTAGTGMGTVEWPTQCTGNQVTLKAVPKLGSFLAGWSGGATGTGLTTTVAMDAPKTVTATFNLGEPVNLLPFYLPMVGNQ